MRTLVCLVFVLVLAFPAWGQPDQVGFLRYGVGELLLDGETLDELAVGSKTVKPEQKFETSKGFAELSLGPDNYLRLGPQSSFQVVSTRHSDMQVRLLGGSLEVEFTSKNANDEISVLVGEAVIKLVKRGQYRLDMTADGDTYLKVLRGQAKVVINGSAQKVKSKQSMLLADSSSPEKFNASEDENDFALWCKERAMEIKTAQSEKRKSTGDMLRDMPMRR